MKVTVYGCGDEDMMVKLIEDYLEVHYELPLGGAHLAYRAAEAGHDVVLCDPSFDISEESMERLESAGVELVTDDTVGAEHGEIQILFTPFGHTVKIARELLDDVREGAVLCTACTCPPIALYHGLEGELRTKREDVGVSSFHPAGIPGGGDTGPDPGGGRAVRGVGDRAGVGGTGRAVRKPRGGHGVRRLRPGSRAHLAHR